MQKIKPRYIPKTLSKRDQILQKRMILRSRKLYKNHKFFTRKKVSSFHSKPSPHIQKAIQIYGIPHITPSPALAKATKCSQNSLSKIVQKGKGAYYSSGSRPNQTPQSWGLARLASSITGGKASVVDYHILEKGCKPNSKALRLAKKTKKQFK
jgi:hypothetical protein